MILQRCFVLSKTFHLLSQNTTLRKATTTLLTQRFIVHDSDIILPTSTKQQNESLSKSKEMKLVELEISYLRESGRDAPNPDLLNKHQWDKVLKLKTKSARYKYYSFLFRIEKMKEKRQIKKEIKKEANAEFMEQRALEPRGPPKSRFLLRVRPKTMDFWRNNRLTRAMQFGDKLIFDCSYDSHMTQREAANTAKQLMYCFSENRRNKQPFDLHFCNVNFDSTSIKALERFIPTMREKAFPLNLHEVSYLDVFDKDKLVYMTPHCKDDLVEYDPDSIYIIGAMVDTVNPKQISLSKAKELGLRMARLPLDRYLKWGCAPGKSLTLDQMMKIMLDLKESRNWQYALRHVPGRKTINEGISSKRDVITSTKNVAKREKSLKIKKLFEE